MPTNNPLPKKNYYTIGEVSKFLLVDQHVIRFWNSKFPQYIKPIRKAGQRRYYTHKDIEMFRNIKTHLYDKGISIKGVHLILKENKTLKYKRKKEVMAIKPEINAVITKLSNLFKEIDKLIFINTSQK